MDMARPDLAQTKERILKRRAARARRSKWLSRLLFSLTGVGLLLLLRTYPGVVADAVSYMHGPGADRSGPGVIAKPSDIRVRTMPGDAVPVRRGGTLPGNGGSGAPENPANQTTAQADRVADQLRSLSPGG
jgi:hypothetical protein